jgi:hypothetical protein
MSYRITPLGATSALVLCLAASPTNAQTAVDGAIGGTVMDSTGAIVSHAAVTVKSNSTGIESTAKSDDSGYFRIIHLQSGSYNVTVTAPGFESYKSENVTVQVGLLTNILARLAPGAATETVSVSGAAPNVNTTNNDFSEEIGQNTINNLPVSNYRWSSYALLTPGVVSDSNGFGLLSFRGQSTLLNNVTFDGADDNQKFFAEERGRTRAGYSTDKWAVEEFQVNSSNYSVEYGRSAGGVVNAVSKSGGNQFHGEGYFFDRDADWGAYNDFTKLSVATATPGVFTQTPFKATDVRKQYGLTVGGPLLRDKLFFFVAADRFQRNFPGVSAPTSPSLFYTSPAATTTNIAALATALGVSTAVATTDYNNAITGLDSLLGSAPRTGDQTVYFPKIDWQVNPRNHASFEFNQLRWTSPAGIQTSTGALAYGVRSYGNDYVRDNWGFARLDTLLTNSISNEVRYQYGRDFEYEYNQQPTAYEQQTLLGPTAGGYTNPFGQVPPNVSISNLFQFGTPTFLERPAYPDERMWQLSDTVLQTIGNHSLKYGYDMVHTNDLSENLTSQYGGYSYSSLVSYIEDYTLAQNPATAAQAKHYSSYGQGFGTLGFDLTTIDYAGFVQDEWKASPRLSTTIGLRYEYEQLPSPQLPNVGNANAEINLPQTTQFPDNRTNVAPRLGFAYQLTGDGKTVVRGGYGLFFARLINSTIYNAIAQTGLLATNASGIPLAQLQFSYQSNTAGAPAFPQVIQSAGAAAITPNAIYFDHNFRLPEIQQADLTVEREIGWNTVISATWLAAWGRRLPDFVDQNALGNVTTVSYTVVDPTGKGPLPNGSIYTTKFYARTAAQKVTEPNGSTVTGYRANPYYGSLTDIFSGVNSDYEGAVIQINHRATKGLEFHANYTFSHALDYGENNTTFTNTNSLYDPTNLQAEYGNSNQNVPNRLVLYSVYTTPQAARGWLGYLLNDYEIAPTYQAQNGLPYNPTLTGSATNLYLDNGTTVTGLGNTLNGSNGANRIGTFARNNLRYPRTQTLDLRLSKRFNVLPEQRVHIELLGEAFNLANHQNVDAVNANAYAITPPSATSTTKVNELVFNQSSGAPVYNTVTNSNSNGFVYSPRQIQLGVRLQF